MSEGNHLRPGTAPVRGQLLDEGEIAELEANHPEGMTSKQVVELFTSRGVKLSEATFRKYVQLGLLPRSRRVRVKGRRRGSLGLYPVSVVRRINEIKTYLAEDFTMDEIRARFLCATSEIDELDESIARVFGRLEKTLSERAEGEDQADLLRRDLEEARRAAETLSVALRRLEDRLGAQARLEQKAVGWGLG